MNDKKMYTSKYFFIITHVLFIFKLRIGFWLSCIFYCVIEFIRNCILDKIVAYSLNDKEREVHLNVIKIIDVQFCSDLWNIFFYTIFINSYFTFVLIIRFIVNEKARRVPLRGTGLL